jgi:hypothetical protein
MPQLDFYCTRYTALFSKYYANDPILELYNKDSIENNISFSITKRQNNNNKKN